MPSVYGCPLEDIMTTRTADGRIADVINAIKALEPTDLQEEQGVVLAIIIMEKVGMIDYRRLKKVLADQIIHEPMPGG